ncbi:MAG: hypothetical protein H6648_09435 [Caldilineae bacterium]|nr:hypothetical protein [Chloroflexota bacterium]MCB9177371.1 hypothetical protein [Caldilineae bacterium]
MTRHSTRSSLAAASLSCLLLLSGCGGRETSEPEAQATLAPPTEAAPPTVVARMEPTATATVDPAAEPMAAVASEGLPGIVVPAAAELVELVEAGEDTDARADYRIDVEGVDGDALYAWFSTELPKLGWGEPEDRDGALIFLHETELGQRFAELGQKRTATLIFDPTDDIDVSILVEAPN